VELNYSNNKDCSFPRRAYLYVYMRPCFLIVGFKFQSYEEVWYI